MSTILAKAYAYNSYVEDVYVIIDLNLPSIKRKLEIVNSMPDEVYNVDFIGVHYNAHIVDDSSLDDEVLDKVEEYGHIVVPGDFQYKVEYPEVSVILSVSGGYIYFKIMTDNNTYETGEISSLLNYLLNGVKDDQVYVLEAQNG